MKIIKNILLWFLVLFYLAAAIIYLPHTSGFLAVAFILLILPVGKWQQLVGKITKGKWKIAICIVLALLTLMLAPTPEIPTPAPSQPNSAATSSMASTPTLPNFTGTPSIPTTNQSVPSTAPAIPTESSTMTAPNLPTDTSIAPTSPTPTTAPSVSEPPSTEPSVPAEYDYILNTSTKKYHEPDCAWAGKIDAENKEYFHGTKDELEAMGYSACKKCYP